MGAPRITWWQWVKNSLLRIENGLGSRQLTVERNQVSRPQVDTSVRFIVTVVDTDTGIIPAAKITVPVNSLTLYQNDVLLVTTTPSKDDGIIYYDYDFPSPTWDEEDEYRVEITGIECEMSGGQMAYAAIQTWVGVITEEPDIEKKVDAIQVDIGDPSSRTNYKSLDTEIGLPDTINGTLSARLGIKADDSQLTSTFSLWDLLALGKRTNYDNFDLYFGLPDDNAGSFYSRLGDLDATDNLRVILGTAFDNTNSIYMNLYEGVDSSSLTPDVDGSTMEMLKAIIAGAIHKLYTEDAPQSLLNVTLADANETLLLQQGTVGSITTRKCLRDLTLFCATLTTETLTVRLYKDTDGATAGGVLIDSFDIKSANDNTWFNLFDMFGKHDIHGTYFRITIQLDAYLTDINVKGDYETATAVV